MSKSSLRVNVLNRRNKAGATASLLAKQTWISCSVTYYDPAPNTSAFPEKLPYTELDSMHPRLVLYGPGSSPFLMTSYKKNNNDLKDNLAVYKPLNTLAIRTVKR